MHFSFLPKMLNLSCNKNDSNATRMLGNNQLSAMFNLLPLKNRFHTQFLSEQAVPQQVDTVFTRNTGRCRKLALHFFFFADLVSLKSPFTPFMKNAHSRWLCKVSRTAESPQNTRLLDRGQKAISRIIGTGYQICQQPIISGNISLCFCKSFHVFF